jgi:hypothetical protein
MGKPWKARLPGKTGQAIGKAAKQGISTAGSRMGLSNFSDPGNSVDLDINM